MTLATRMTLIVTLMVALARVVSAQETTATTTAATTTTAAGATDTEGAASTAGEVPIDTASYEIRNRFTSLLRNHPPELAMILKLDPTLLSNETFLAGYPSIGRFLDKYPEVRLNPRFHLAEFPTPGHDNSILDEIVQIFAVFSGFALGLFALGWFVRTLIEQRRWTRLSRTQSEVHNKILDRFGSSEEVLQYIKSPAGAKFLESAPIAVRAEPPVKNAPLTRIMWSIQLGVVIVAAGLGMLLVSLRFSGETGQGLFAIGAIAFFMGAGFIASAAASIVLSRRLGLWKEPDADESGMVR